MKLGSENHWMHPPTACWCAPRPTYTTHVCIHPLICLYLHYFALFCLLPSKTRYFFRIMQHSVSGVERTTKKKRIVYSCRCQPYRDLQFQQRECLSPEGAYPLDETGISDVITRCRVSLRPKKKDVKGEIHMACTGT